VTPENRYENQNCSCSNLGPNPGPGRRPSDSGRGDVEFAGVFAPVASLAVSFVAECIFWEPAEYLFCFKYARAMAGGVGMSLFAPGSPNIKKTTFILAAH